MKKPHRIAAGGLVFRDEAVLLVRYRNGSGGTYLVGPGGALEDDENVVQAIVRETFEETSVTVQTKRVAAIEDLMCPRFKMIKVWMICHVVAGEVRRTKGAEAEGIIQVGWFTRAQLAGEVVFPSPLRQYDWRTLCGETWQVLCLPCRNADF